MGHLNPGYHSFIWDALDMYGNISPSGFYIYQIKGSEMTHRNKMILMK